MEFRLLGPLEVEDDGRTIALGPAKERTLLAVLLLARGRPVSTDELTEALWAGNPPATATKSIQVYVAHLRRALGADRIVTRERGYEVLVGHGELDLDRFDLLVREAAGAEPKQAAERLAEALGLVRGPPLGELQVEPWAVPQAGRLNERVLDATEARVDADLALGRHREVVVELEELVAENPFREHLLEQLMVALYGSGRQADALAAYRRGSARLRDELGLEPGPALRELEGRMLRQDASLDPPATAGAETVRRRSWAVVAVGAVALVGAAAAALLLARDDSTALASIPPGVALIDAQSGRLVAHIPHDEIAGPVESDVGTGSFWVASIDPPSQVQISPHTGEVLKRIGSPFGANTGWALADGHDVWFTGLQDLVRVDAREGAVVDRYPLVLEKDHRRFGLQKLTRCAGSLWVVDVDDQSVVRIDPETGRVRARIFVQLPWAIACGDGGLWVTSNFAGLSRIDPTQNEVAATAQLETHLDQAAVGGGFGWTTDEQRGELYKVDRDGRIVATYATGDGARVVSYAGGRMWVANQDSGTVTGVDVVTGDERTFRFGHPVQTVAALGDRLLVTLNDGLTYEDRIDQLQGKVAKLINPIYAFDPPDPAVGWNPWMFLVERATCSTLLAFSDPAHSDSRLRPDLAAAMPRVSNGGKTYTFTVRAGRRFAPPSSGTVTAEDVRTSIERALSSKLAVDSPGLTFLTDLVGAADYHYGHADHVSGMRVRGHTISFTLRGPSPSFLTRLSRPFYCVVPPDTPAIQGGIPTVAPPSAGPYYMTDRINGEYMIIRRNPNYNGPTPARLDAIAFREGLSPEKAVARVRAGDWDGVVLDDTLLGPDSPVARAARRGGTLRWAPFADVTYPEAGPPIYSLLSTRLGCEGRDGALDLATLCIRE